MATNFRREIGRNRRHAFLLGTRIPQRIAEWRSGWAPYQVNSEEVLPTSCKMVNFSPLTLEFTVMVWRLFMRQMGEIGVTRSILKTRIRQWMTGTAERFAPNSYGRHVWSFARTSWNVKIKSQRSRSPGTKRCGAFTTPRSINEMERPRCR